MEDFKISPIKLSTKIIIFAICLTVCSVLSFLYIQKTWTDSVAKNEFRILQSTKIAAAGIHETCIEELLEGMDDKSVEYLDLKKNLTEIRQSSEDVKFAYIFYLGEDGKVYFLADSEPIGSEDYSPMGQLYYEATDYDLSPFSNKQIVFSDVVEDRWGKWRSVLVPIIDSQTNEVLVVFGVDYEAESFNNTAILNTIKSAVVAISISLIIYGLLYAVLKNRELRYLSGKLAQSDSLFRSVFNQASVGIAIVNNNQFRESFGDFPSMNPKFEEIIGRPVDELVNRDWAEFTHPEDLQLDLDKYSKFKAGETDGYEMDKRFIQKDGNYVWVHMIVSPLNLKNNPENNHLTIIEDIRSRKELERGLLESERSKAVLLDNLPGMTYRCNYDKNWTMKYVSNGCFDLTGYSPDSLLDNRVLCFNDLILEKYRNYLWDKWELVVKEHGKLKEEYKIQTASGEIRWVYEQGQPVYNEQGDVEALEGIIIDITERKNYEKELKYLSERDPVTGMLNMRSFEKTIKKRDISVKSAVITINIRKFNNISSYLGYNSVQRLLKEITDYLQPQLINDRLLFHITDDMFILFVPIYNKKEEIIDICQAVIGDLDTNLYNKTVNFSIGVLELDRNTQRSPEEILKKVIIATEQTDDSERFGLSFYDEETELKLKRENEIKEALTTTAYDDNDSSLFLVYQPILDLKTNKIFGFEALARYRHESLGLVPPMEFITIAENSKLIMPIGHKILKCLFSFIKRLNDEGSNSVVFSFNISVIQLLQDNFVTELVNLINEYGIETKNLNVELTESMFMSNFQVINEKIGEINKMGLKVSIDDFGTGYSSLSRVRELNVNCLKIDKYFIDKLLQTDEKNTIISDIISMAHNMKLFVVAEGVEHEKQKFYLTENNCDMMQGYFFSKPVDEETAYRMIKERQNDTVEG